MPYEKLTQNQSNLIIGMKQTLRSIKSGEISEVFIAEDADRRVIDPVITLAEELDIPYHRVSSKEALGSACGIEVGTSTAAIKR